jgi:hypothetical protein
VAELLEERKFSKFLINASAAGLPDFSWYNRPKREKCTKISTEIRNGHTIYQNSQNAAIGNKFSSQGF